MAVRRQGQVNSAAALFGDFCEVQLELRKTVDRIRSLSMDEIESIWDTRLGDGNSRSLLLEQLTTSERFVSDLLEPRWRESLLDAVTFSPFMQRSRVIFGRVEDRISDQDLWEYVEKFLYEQNNDWDFRRMAELLLHIERWSLLGRLCKIAGQSGDEQIIEVGRDFSPRLPF